jgi:branched-chain amino acid aminotransferase
MQDFYAPTAYFCGKFVDESEAVIPVTHAAFQYGLSVYTAANLIRKDDNVLGFRLADHYKRLCNSAKILNMQPLEKTITYDDFLSIVQGLIDKNSLSTSAIIRINYFVDSRMAGTKIDGLPCSISAFLLPFGAYYHKPSLDVMVSSWRRVNDNAIPPRAKVTGSYVNSSLMKSEALRNGFDDCIALDAHGHVSEGAVANLFMIRDRVLVTPSVESDILEGITRDTILEIAKTLGLVIQTRAIDRTELYIADELFFSGSSARIMPISSVDHRQIGNGDIGDITKRLAEKYAKIQGGDEIIHVAWLHKFNQKGVVL